MKRFFKLAALVLSVVVLSSCDDDKTYNEPSLDVTLNNIAGTWKLVALDGQPLAENSYAYIEFVRRDATYTMYDNLDSFSARKLTGSFAIYTDEVLGAIIRGMYDYDRGDWTQRYIVNRLTADKMTWTAKDDSENQLVYERSEIPAEISGAAE